MARNMIPSLIGTAIMALAVMVHPAAAQPVLNCAEHSKVVDFLGSHYSETLQAVGFINQAAILEVYVSESRPELGNDPGGSGTENVKSTASQALCAFTRCANAWQGLE
jgi:hypothetical protein